MDPAESSWSMASVGRMTITLKKRTGPDNWARLSKSKKKPNNIHFWWELHEKHAKELEALEDDDDEGSNDPVVKPPATSAADELKKEKEEKDTTVTPDSASASSSGSGGDLDSSEDAKDGVIETEADAAVVKPKKEKKKKIKKEKKDKKPKEPTLEDLVKDLEKEGKERKKDIDRKAKADKEAINLDTEEKIKTLKREFYKKDKNDAKKSGADTDVPPSSPTDLDKLLPGDGGSTGEEAAVTDAIREEL